jgi:hypothetical protein
MSDSATDLASAIEQGVTAPKSVSTESGSVSQHDPTQLIEADRYLRSRAAASNPFRALRRARLLFGRADGHTSAGSSNPPYPVDAVPQ